MDIAGAAASCGEAVGRALRSKRGRCCLRPLKDLSLLLFDKNIRIADLISGRARAPGSRPCRPGRGAHPLFVGDSAALCAPIEEPRGVDPDPLLEGHIHGRLRGGAGRLAWQGCRWPFGVNRRPAQGRLDRGATALVESEARVSEQKQTTKRCHWVSQSYLRTFATDPDTRRKIWRFSKNGGRASSANQISTLGPR